MLPTGALSFVPAHTEGTPVTKNGTTTGFSYVNGTAAGELGRFQFEEIGSKDEGGWLACPVNASAGMYHSFIAVPFNCYGIVRIRTSYILLDFSR